MLCRVMCTRVGIVHIAHTRYNKRDITRDGFQHKYETPGTVRERIDAYGSVAPDWLCNPLLKGRMVKVQNVSDTSHIIGPERTVQQSSGLLH